jgi:hypothetical protein
MALGSTKPLTEMSTKNLPGGKKRPTRMDENLAAIYGPRRLATLRASTARTGIVSPLPFTFSIIIPCNGTTYFLNLDSETSQ